MAVKRILQGGTVYGCRHHLVWTPKYRELIDRKDMCDRIEELFREIADRHEFEMDKLQVSEDHLDIFLSFPPRYSISEVVGMLIVHSGTASEIFKEFLEVKRQLWGGVFWEDGYFVQIPQRGRDEMTAEVVRRYIEYHKDEKSSQLVPLCGIRCPALWVGSFAIKSINTIRIESHTCVGQMLGCYLHRRFYC